MKYVVDFSIISFVYLFITTFFYLKQNKIFNIRSYYFTFLLILGLISLFFDVFVVIIDGSMNVPVFISYVLNILFLACIQLNGPTFLSYTLIITGLYPKVNKRTKRMIYLPFILISLLILISPFLNNYGVFSISKDNVYEIGKTHDLLYVVMGFYLVVSLLISIVKLRKIQKKKVISIFVFLLLTFITMILQLLFPDYLLNCMGNALALSIMYHALEVPDENIDPLTKLLNRDSMNTIIKDLYEQNQKFTIMIYALYDFGSVNQEYGVKSGDDLMFNIANYLKKTYPKQYIFRIIGDVYGVINISNNEKLTITDVKNESESFPHEWEVSKKTISLNSSVIGINSDDFSDFESLNDVIKYILLKHEKEKKVLTILVDKKYREERGYYLAVEEILKKAIDNETIDVYYQPIHGISGNLVALEALCRLNDKKLGFINPDLFIGIAEKNGSIYRLGEIVLEKVCKFIKTYNIEEWNIHHIGVNLSFLQCTKADVYNTLEKIIEKYGITKNLISFEITETVSSKTISEVKDNMIKFIDDGYSFLLDDFGSGYANYNYILELPFRCIKIDKNILWKAMENQKDMLYLKALIKSLNKLNLLTVCEGVETKEQAKILVDIGVTMQQGFLYSKALSPVDILNYSKKYLHIS